MPCFSDGEGNWICTHDDIERVETTTTGEWMQGKRSYIEVPVREGTMTSEGAQDLKDGAAIRHLWEALADLPSSEVVVSITSENIEVTVIAHGVDCDDERNDFIEMTAPTIAEAADKCREVLA